eukprot:CAMPEP_0194371592 /NCGR_PEP_ID=MMETSP0174-20130528/20011_1 /TAXON_ID=216777 /ORGANISM="Proboscia alata, Strain PI-D3" /LENGTH=301 /DNA_ID=CAMNT_0039149753 /DNA_START=58 /DNA_END=963 /DNA_ORIENTATION=+
MEGREIIAPMMGVKNDRNDIIKKARHHRKMAEDMLRCKKFKPNLKLEHMSAAYQKSAEYMRMCDRWHDSAEAYSYAARAEAELKNTEEAALLLVEAAEAAQRACPIDAVPFYNRSISHFSDAGKLKTAGILSRRVAKIYEDEKNFVDAIDYFQKAANFFMATRDTNQYAACRLNTAGLMMQSDQFLKAMEVLCEVGFAQMELNLTQFNARQYFLRACLLLLALGKTKLSLIEEKLNEFKKIDPTFIMSREYLFLKNIKNAAEDGNFDLFIDHVHLFILSTEVGLVDLLLLDKAKKWIEIQN